MTKETGGPAFPTSNWQQMTPLATGYREGMTLRQYAAIKLKVPNSGDAWLDDMIRESLQNDFAAKAMQAIVGNSIEVHPSFEAVAEDAYMQADAMLKARGQ